MSMSVHVTQEQLTRELEKRSLRVPLWSVWYHRKNTEISYLITDLVIDESTDEVAVVYEQQYTRIRFVRLAKIFTEEVVYAFEERGPRFIRDT